MINDGTALFTAILANPDEDAVRLVYADWLQENDDEALAEFIRVQVETARLEPIVEGQPDEENDFPLWARYDTLCKREYVLLAANPHWRPTCPMCEGGGKLVHDSHHERYYDCATCKGTGHIGECRRGFVDSVPVGFEDVFYDAADEEDCWLPTQWARDTLKPFLPTIARMPVVNAQPVQWQHDRLYRWYNGTPIHPDDMIIPEPLTKRLLYREFKTAEAANDALAATVLQVLREMLK
jgi:uncharacterized protein (TIGR02996 family)